MEFWKLIDEEQHGDMNAPRVVSFADGDGELQLQIEQDYNDAFVDLKFDEVVMMHKQLGTWIDESERA
jgi:hypothetical protein